VDVVRGLQDGVRGEDSGGDALGRILVGLLDAVRMVRVLRLVGERLSSAARSTRTRNGRDDRGSDLSETRKQQRRSGTVSVPQQTGFRAVRGQPGQSSNGDE